MFGISIDTSSPTGSVSILKVSKENQHKLIRSAEYSRSSGKGSHAEVMTSLLQDCLMQEKIDISDLKFIVVGTGPGSFTGVRVGVNIARSLGYSLSIPVIPVCSLELMAAHFLEIESDVLCGMNAFRNLIYVSRYKRTPSGYKVEIEPCCLKIDQFIKLIQTDQLVLGDTCDFFPQLKQVEKARFKSCSPHSSFADSYLKILDLGKSSDFSWKTVKPLYIRDSEPEEKLKSGELKPVFYRKT